MMQEGYKQTELGVIPEDWEIKKIGILLSKFTLGGNYENSIDSPSGIPLIKMGNIGRGKILTEKIEYIADNIDYSETDILKKDDILFNTRNTLDLVGKVSIWKDELPFALYNSNLLKLEFKAEYIENNDFINYQFNSQKVLSTLKRYATGTTSVAAIYTRDLLKVNIPLPPLPEQTAIADCLTTWDDAIEKQTQLIKAKEERHKALMQQLLSGKKRLPGFTEEWKEYKYSDLLKEVKRKEIWDDTKLYELISVKRRSGGVFHRDSLYGYQIEVKALVKIKENDFLISKMQIVHGASSIVNKEFENFYVSGSYIILNVKNEKVLNPKFLNLFSKQKSFYYQTFVSSYGVHIEKMTFHFKTFLNTTAVIPSISEQNSIVEIIETSENEISLEKQKLNQLKEQKKALMQKLLIGKVRLPFAS